MKNINKQIIIQSSDLPLFCNGSFLDPDVIFGSSILHPMVYINISSNQVAICPYCGMQYVLINKSSMYD